MFFSTPKIIPSEATLFFPKMIPNEPKFKKSSIIKKTTEILQFKI